MRDLYAPRAGCPGGRRCVERLHECGCYLRKMENREELKEGEVSREMKGLRTPVEFDADGEQQEIKRCALG